MMTAASNESKTPTNTPTQGPDQPLSAGTSAGIGVGVGFGTALVVVGVAFWFLRRRRDRRGTILEDEKGLDQKQQLDSEEVTNTYMGTSRGYLTPQELGTTIRPRELQA